MANERENKAKLEQGHDANPPRCANCVYFRRERHTLYTEKRIVTRKGKVKFIKVKVKANPISNPIVERCSFGNFLSKPHHICDKWHGSDGSKLEDDS